MGKVSLLSLNLGQLLAATSLAVGIRSKTSSPFHSVAIGSPEMNRLRFPSALPWISTPPWSAQILTSFPSVSGRENRSLNCSSPKEDRLRGRSRAGPRRARLVAGPGAQQWKPS
jgi:hypothetical protein